MRSNVSQLILDASKLNSFLGAIIIPIILLIFNINIAIAFLVGNILSTLNFAANGIVIKLVLNEKISSLFMHLSLVIRLGTIVGIAYFFSERPLSLTFYVLALIVQQFSIIFYKANIIKLFKLNIK